MSNSFFYLQVEKHDENQAIIDSLQSYSIENMKQLYVIDKPLGDKKYSYDFDKVLVLLSPEHQVTFLNLGSDIEEFEGFIEDFIEDLGSISDKYRYKDKIGRPREWKKKLIHIVDNCAGIDFPSLFTNTKLDAPNLRRKSELLISLLTGSINDIEKVNTEVSDNILDRVKQKILLFDGDQTRFIYEKKEQDIIRIQGMSGTGKTELLLHKLKEIYINSEGAENRILFTCHNRILASSLKKRIPDFFDFMKVEQQILWNERLWCVSAWGSQYDNNSGAYTFICHHYGIQFHRFNYNISFDFVCKKAIEFIKKNNLISTKGYAFDYVLLDESQDFPDSFIELCNISTKKNTYVAGDIFQSIFDENLAAGVTPDYLLSKCYRTDPRTLMFAHALGMGLFETPKLKWLKDEEWQACGYQIDKDNGHYELSREPLRRFEDLLSDDYSSVEVVKTSAELAETSETKIIEIIRTIIHEYPTVSVDDIGVIFIDSADYVYATADSLFFSIKKEFGWDVNKAYESKSKIKNSLFVSNKNNVKGLEFPFVICVTKKLNNYRSYRNALYMMLTRSFLKSFLLISKDSNPQLTDVFESELNKINQTGKLRVIEPNANELRHMKETIVYKDTAKPFYDSVYELFDELEVPNDLKKQIYKIVKATTSGETFDKKMIASIVDFNMALVTSKKDI